jgi:hypothetical protein
MLDDAQFEEATKGLKEAFAPQLAKLKETLELRIKSGTGHPFSDWLNDVWEGASSHSSRARRVVAMAIGIVVRENDAARLRGAKDEDALAFLDKYQAILVRVMSEPDPS